MATLDARLRTLEASRQAGPLAGASLVDSEVWRLMTATTDPADLAGLLRRLEDGTTRPDDLAGLRTLAALRIVE